MRFALMVFAAMCLGGVAHGQTEYVTGAPYTAKATMTTEGHRKAFETATLARASDGSTYRMVYAMGKVNYRNVIEDVPGHRVIFLNPRNHTYTIKEDQEMKTLTAEQFAERSEALQKEYAARPGFSNPIGERTTRTALGTKVENGFKLYGKVDDFVQVASEIRGHAKPAMTTHTEEWSTDFGVTTLMVFTLVRGSADSPDYFSKQTTTVTNIRREEPSSALFRIPDGYKQLEQSPTDAPASK
jgi:hypothetical protein